jgi:uncharacterized protein (UPF0332 family)
MSVLDWAWRSARSGLAGVRAPLLTLLALGQTRSKHSGVISGFSSLVVRQGGFDPRVAAPLRDLFEERNDVDYGLEDPTADEARKRRAQARRFVDEVERWIESQGASGS